MCGICGIVNYDNNEHVEKTLISRMCDVMRHRGPDDEGIYISNPESQIHNLQSQLRTPNSELRKLPVSIGLGHRRLSIVDLSGGHQPMGNEDGTVWIVYNGEIYNHLELRHELVARGHHYKTNSDTETIVHLYEEFGEECVQRLRGMFAFAVWDESQQKLFCARDRLGIKPFYFWRNDERFLFASEIKCILEDSRIERRPNYSAFSEYFLFGYLSNNKTLFQNVFSLPPGNTATIKDGKLTIRKYWDVEPANHDFRTEKEWRDSCLELLENSVKARLMSDVPLGVFLSGGVDSSAIAAIMNRHMKDPLMTFSVGYSEAGVSELNYAETVAKHLNTDHHKVLMPADDFWDSIPSLIWHEDEPITWPSSVALYFVSKLASEHVKVVLTGEGADELFGGYERYLLTLWNIKIGRIYESLVPEFIRNGVVAPFLDRLPMPLYLKRKVKHTFLNYPTKIENIYCDNFLSTFSEVSQRDMFAEKTITKMNETNPYASVMNAFNSRNGFSFLDKLLYTDQKTYLVELLMKQDNMSMATSLESRVPFLDHTLVEFAASVPPEYKIKGFSGKKILKDAVESLLPPEIIHRTKMGFPTPIKSWFKGRLKGKIENVLLDQRTLQRGIFKPEFINKIVSDNSSGRADNTDRIWCLLNFELWYRIFFENDFTKK